MELELTTSESARKAIKALGRTEDLKFSPDNRRLAIADFDSNKITLFDILIETSVAAPTVALTGAMEIFSSHLKTPHGLSFIDNDTLVVTSRSGETPIYRLPAAGVNTGKCELEPVNTIRADQFHLLHTPGSVSVFQIDRDRYELLICNNYAHNVTRHILSGAGDGTVEHSEVLLEKGLAIPDGVAVSKDNRWLAISNHEAHSIYLYENSPDLNRDSIPAGILRGGHFPHGLRFTPDDHHIIMADAGSPYVHIYARHRNGWAGVQNPTRSFRIMDDEVYLRGRYNPREGGPKGIDVDNGMSVFATTCEQQPLAFFDMRAALRDVNGFSPPAADNPDIPNVSEYHAETARRQKALDVEFELQKHAWLIENKRHLVETEARVMAAESLANAVINSKSWRFAAPLRWMRNTLFGFLSRRIQ